MKSPEADGTIKLGRQEAFIVNALREAGTNGVRNVELNSICFGYNARLWTLRRCFGFVIDEELIHGSLHRYTLKQEPRGPVVSKYLKPLPRAPIAGSQIALPFAEEARDGQ